MKSNEVQLHWALFGRVSFNEQFQLFVPCWHHRNAYFTSQNCCVIKKRRELCNIFIFASEIYVIQFFIVNSVGTAEAAYKIEI